jgi:hypothetical protein
MKSTGRCCHFFMKGNSMNWTFPKIVFLPTSNFHQKAWGRNFLLLVIIHIANVPDMCKSLAIKIVIKNVHENMTALHM